MEGTDKTSPGSLPSTAQRTLAGQHDVALVRALCAGALARAVDGRPEEVGARVYARGVDVVVLCEVAHLGCGAGKKTASCGVVRQVRGGGGYGRTTYK